MMSRNLYKLGKRKKTALRLNQRNLRKNLFSKRTSDIIIDYEFARRKEPLKNIAINRILLDWDYLPAKLSKYCYNQLKTKKGLGKYLRDKKNQNYTERLITDESRLVYENVYGLFEEPQTKTLKKKTQEALENIAGAVQTIADQTQEAIKKTNPKTAY